MAGPAELNPRPPDLEGVLRNSVELQSGALNDLLTKFKNFCRIDRQLAVRTADDDWGYPYQVRRLLKSLRKDPRQVTAEDIRSYLLKFQDRSASTRANILKGLKVFFRDFMQMPQVVSSFKFPKRVYTPQIAPTKEDLGKFFDVLECDRDRAIFLLFASSGLRRNELLTLTVDEVDLENRLIIPKNKHQTGTTKNTWATCFNPEAETYLRRYLESRSDKDSRVFPIAPVTLKRSFSRASKRSGVYLTPKTLRLWFCCELSELGVPESIIDALCGRVPKTVLGRHYNDYSPERLKRIYDKANLAVLT